MKKRTKRREIVDGVEKRRKLIKKRGREKLPVREGWKMRWRRRRTLE